MDVRTLDGRAYAKFVAGGAYFVGKYRQVLNDLNVFPVPDGDTGTNLYLTTRQAALEAGKASATAIAAIAAAAARGALMGARGNSGVIFSQLLRGFAHHVREREAIDTQVLASGLSEAVESARNSLVTVIEGTVISVAQAAAQAAHRLAGSEPDFYRCLSGVLEEANAALDRTPEQLPALKEAGVVDAGGAGFVYFLEGATRFLPGVHPRETAFPRMPVRRNVFTARQVVGERKYCTEFILEQAICLPVELQAVLDQQGDSLIIAGEPPTLKVHLHTDDPARVRTAAQAYGVLARWKVDDMERQHTLLVVEPPPSRRSIVALVPGAGFGAIAKDLGADVTVDAARNPSVREIVLAINACLGDEVCLFVNDENARLAAEQAAALSGRTVRVLATPDVLAGIAGQMAMRSNDAASDAEIMRAASSVRSAQVFFAGKDASVGGTTVVRAGPAALSSGVLYPGTTLADAATAALRAMGAGNGGLITVYYGGAQKENDAQRLAGELRSAFENAEVEWYYGGQINAEFSVSLDE